MSSTKEKAVFLAVDTDNRIQAYFADIPDEGTIQSLTLQGPIYVDSSGIGHREKPYKYSAAVPSYDYQNQEIIWPCHGMPADWNGAWFINVYRLGAHFSLTSVEDTTLPTQAWVNPSLIQENGTLSVGVTYQYKKEDTVGLARRGKDNKWTVLPSEKAPRSTGNYGSLLIKPKLEEATLKYIYFIRGTQNNIALVDVISEANYDRLSDNPNVRWQRFEVNLGFELRTAAATILFDEETKKHRLYVFQTDNHHDKIYYGYIPLRSDGSVDSYEPKFDGRGKQAIPVPFTDPSKTELMLLESGGRLIVMRYNFYDDKDDKRRVLRGWSGTIGSNGAAPNGDEWTEMKFEYDSKKPMPKDPGSVYSAVVVPSDYV